MAEMQYRSSYDCSCVQHAGTNGRNDGIEEDEMTK